MTIYAIDGVRVCSRPMQGRRICGRKPGHTSKCKSVEAMARKVRGRTKRCCSCKQLKKVTEFHKNFGTKDGLRGMCKVCHIAYNLGPGTCNKRGCNEPRYKNDNPTPGGVGYQVFCYAHGKRVQTKFAISEARKARDAAWEQARNGGL